MSCGEIEQFKSCQDSNFGRTILIKCFLMPCACGRGVGREPFNIFHPVCPVAQAEVDFVEKAVGIDYYMLGRQEFIQQIRGL